MTERHVKRFVFGKLLPIRGVDNVWERRYGWHWVVEAERLEYCKGYTWRMTEWLKTNTLKYGFIPPPPPN